NVPGGLKRADQDQGRQHLSVLRGSCLSRYPKDRASSVPKLTTSLRFHMGGKSPPPRLVGPATAYRGRSACGRAEPATVGSAPLTHTTLMRSFSVRSRPSEVSAR